MTSSISEEERKRSKLIDEALVDIKEYEEGDYVAVE